jgi:NAD(P)-dependent dehydrogenase (short-subunit alcohol dehydrogenase family)
MQLQGKRIIITGGASGIGEATVRACAREGASVVALDIADEPGATVAASAATLGPHPVKFMHCDISDRGQVDGVFDQAATLMGGLDALIHMAGNHCQKPADELTEEDLDLVHRVHVKGTVFTNQAAFRAMKAKGGSIVNAGSMAGVRGFPGNAAYCEAKGAVLAWTRSVAQEWARARIRVNAICPMVMTAMAQQWLDEMAAESRKNIDAFLRRSIPLGGWYGAADDAANLNLFLASDASGFITGQTLAVDGGMMMVS